MKKSSKYVLQIFLYCFLFIFFLIIMSSKTASSWWTKNIAVYYHEIIGTITNILPFNLFELIVLLLVSLALYYFVKIIQSFKQKNKFLIAKRIYNFFTYFLKLILIYTAIAGVAFYREALPFKLYEDEVSQEYLDSALNYYLSDYNSLSKTFARNNKNVSICPYSFSELSSLMQKEITRLDKFDYFTKHNAKAKSAIISPILSELHITGINFAFSSEAMVNTSMPSIDLPFTIAHEIAHNKGVLREDDANLVALYICMTSQDNYVRYSGYFRGFYSLLEIKQLTSYADYEGIVKQLSQEILYDNNDYVNYFRKHDMMKDVANFFNNIYLKFYGQKDGVGTYDDRSDVEDTNQKDENGHPIYQYINYSPFQKMMLELYKDYFSV